VRCWLNYTSSRSRQLLSSLLPLFYGNLEQTTRAEHQSPCNISGLQSNATSAAHLVSSCSASGMIACSSAANAARRSGRQAILRLSASCKAATRAENGRQGMFGNRVTHLSTIQLLGGTLVAGSSLQWLDMADHVSA
jgi:hypothetical protein